MLAIKNTGQKPRFIQKGLREKLLCDECEGLLANRYEDYFAKLWYVSKALPKICRSNSLEIRDIDYSLFKLFHLSILWRAGVSSLSPFASVRLNSFEEPIRKMLLDNDAKSPADFQMFGVVIVTPDDRNVFDEIIMAPIATSFKNIPAYIFLFGGCAWHYLLHNFALPEANSVSLQANGSLQLPVRDIREFTPLIRFFRETPLA